MLIQNFYFVLLCCTYQFCLGDYIFGCSSSWVSISMQMMWHLVHSSWILHVSCNKRRVAPIAALLSGVLHYSVFGDEGMHVTDNGPGPLKWVCGTSILVGGLAFEL